MTLNGVMAVIVRYCSEFGSFRLDEFLSVFDSVLIPMHVVVEITITLNG